MSKQSKCFKTILQIKKPHETYLCINKEDKPDIQAKEMCIFSLLIAVLNTIIYNWRGIILNSLW